MNVIVNERKIKISSDQEVVESLRSLILQTVENVQEMKGDKKKLDETIKSVLDNDSTYVKHAEDAKEASRIKSNTKKEIFKRPDVKHVVERKLELHEDIKAEEEQLDAYLQDYYDKTGTDVIEDRNGNVLQVIKKFKVVQKGLFD